MKTLNVRLVAILLGGTVLFGAFVYGVRYFQVRRHAGILLTQADELEQQAEAAADEEEFEKERRLYNEAMKKLTMYTDLVPDNTDVVERLGFLRFDLGDFVRAHGTLEKVLRAEPERAKARRKAVEAAMAIGRFDDARNHLERNLLPDAPDNGELLELLGMCQVRTGENDKAVESFQRAVENSPQRVRSYQLLAMILTDRNLRLGPDLEEDRLTLADNWIMKMMEANAGSPRAHLTYVEYIAKLTQVNTIETAWKHPLLLEKIMPSLLGDSVELAVAQLETPPDENATNQMQQQGETVRKVVQQTIETLRDDLKLDDPHAMLQATLTGLRFDDLTDAEIEQAKKETLAALQADLSQEEITALQTAIKHGVLVGAVKHALDHLEDPSMMLRSAKLSLIDDAVSHASKTRAFVAADRASLAAAEKDGILAAAIEQALAAKDPEALTLKSIDQTVAAAVAQATQDAKLPDDPADARTKAQKNEVLVDTVGSVFVDRQLAADDPERLRAVVKQEGQLPRIVARTAKKRDTALEQRDRHAILILSRVALQQGEVDRARSRIEDGLQQYPDDVRMYALRSDLDQQSGEMDKAIDGLREGLKQTKDAPMLLWKLGLALIAADRLDEAEPVIEQLAEAEYRYTSELPPAEVAESFLQGQLAFQQDEWLAASKKMAQLRGRLTEWPDLLKQAEVLLGVCYTNLGDSDRQLAAFRRALEIDPFDRASLSGMADGLTRQGKINEALTYRTRLAALGGGNPLQLVRSMIQANLRRPPLERDWTSVQTMLDQIAAADPESAPLAILQAEVHLAQGKGTEAQEVLNEAWKRHPKNTAVWSTLAALEQQLENWDRVEELLLIAEKTIDDPVTRFLVRVQYETHRYVDEIPQRLDAAIKAVDAFPEADRLRVLNGLLSASIRTGADEQALIVCRRLCTLQPNNVRTHFLCFQLTVRTKDQAAMKEMLAKIEQIEGKSAHWYYGSAVILSLSVEDGQDKRLDEALKLLAEAGRQRPQWGQPILLEAGIHDQKGDIDSALENYLLAIELGQANTKAYRRAVDLLTHKGRHAEAQNILEGMRLLGSTNSEEGMRQQARVDLAKGDLDSAVKKAREVAERSQDYQDHIWLGQLLSQKAQVSQRASQADEAQQLANEAEEAYRRAVELSDTTAATWLPLIHFYSVMGANAKAEQALAEARTKIPVEKSPLAMGQIYEALGRTEDARKSYQQAVQASPNSVAAIQRVVRFYIRNGDFKEAETQLQRIFDGPLNSDPATVGWARRRKADILRLQGGYPNLQQAIALVEKNLASEARSAEDTLLLAGLLANSPSYEHQERAITTLDSLPAPSAGNQFALAQLYLAHDKSDLGMAVLNDLLARHGDHPKYLAAYVDALLQRNRVQEAEVYLKKLEGIAPNHFNVVNLRAESLFRQANYSAALNLVADFLNRDGAVPSDDGQRLDLVSSKLETFRRRLNAKAAKAGNAIERDALKRNAAGYASQSELVFRGFVNDRPSFRMLLAAFLARQDKIDAAIEMVDQAWSDGPAEVVARTMLALMKSPAATPEQLARAEQILQSALAKYNTSLPLRLAAADIRSSQGRYQEAEQAYRAVLRIDPNNITAKNNLAVQFAQRKTNLAEAAKLVDEAIAMAGPIPQILDSRAIVHLAAGNPQKALDDLNIAIAQDSSAVKLFHQAQALRQLNRREEAVAAWKKAVDAGLDADAVEKLELPVYQQLKSDLGASL